MIKKITDKDTRKGIARNILEALDEWFEVEESREQYIAESADMTFFAAEEDAVGKRMEIGYISRKNMLLSDLAERYIRELDRYLKQYQETHN